MEHDVKPYRQRGMTCAIACMLMVLEYYKIIPKANWRYEKKYDRCYRSRYMVGTPFSALAWHFTKNGLKTELIHSEKELFVNHGFLPEKAFDLLIEEYKDYLKNAEEKGAVIKKGVFIDSNLLKEELKQNKLVILAGQIHNNLHAILLCGYEADSFIICDPLYKEKQRKTAEEIENFIDTIIGKWCICVKSDCD